MPMNRPIRFRVYNNAAKKWVHGPGQEVNLFGETILLGGFMRVPFEELNDCEALEFTGMVDRNGTEIYEGDICYAHKSNSYLDGNYVVAWHDTKGRWYYKNQPEYKDLYQVGCAGNLKCEVIGNIFDNPELLK